MNKNHSNQGRKLDRAKVAGRQNYEVNVPPDKIRNTIKDEGNTDFFKRANRSKCKKTADIYNKN
jgi:hypothetical protein